MHFYFVTDINECNQNPCHSEAQCTNTDGSFVCTCNVGYNGTGFDCAGVVNVGSFQNTRIVYCYPTILRIIVRLQYDPDSLGFRCYFYKQNFLTSCWFELLSQFCTGSIDFNFVSLNF